MAFVEMTMLVTTDRIEDSERRVIVVRRGSQFVYLWRPDPGRPSWDLLGIRELAL